MQHVLMYIGVGFWKESIVVAKVAERERERSGVGAGGDGSSKGQDDKTITKSILLIIIFQLGDHDIIV